MMISSPEASYPKERDRQSEGRALRALASNHSVPWAAARTLSLFRRLLRSTGHPRCQWERDLARIRLVRPPRKQDPHSNRLAGSPSRYRYPGGVEEPTVIAAFGDDRGSARCTLSSACASPAEVESVLLKMSGETEGAELRPSGVSLLTGIDLLARSNGVGQLFGYASRLLRPGGRLVLVDFFLRDDLRSSGDLDEGDRLGRSRVFLGCE